MNPAAPPLGRDACAGDGDVGVDADVDVDVDVDNDVDAEFITEVSDVTMARKVCASLVASAFFK
jgi:hypothetical protein